MNRPDDTPPNGAPGSDEPGSDEPGAPGRGATGRGDGAPDPIQPWERLGSTVEGEHRVFRVRADRLRSPRTGDEHTFYVIEATDWVNVIPVTPDGRFVFVRQWRHGTEEVTLEVPGGLVDAGEDAAEAARREMREETGYDTSELVYLGTVAPNPAIMDNACATYLALDARPVAETAFDEGEDIEVVLVDPADVPRLVREGAITHALVVVAFYLFEVHRGRVA